MNPVQRKVDALLDIPAVWGALWSIPGTLPVLARHHEALGELARSSPTVTAYASGALALFGPLDWAWFVGVGVVGMVAGVRAGVIGGNGTDAVEVPR